MITLCAKMGETQQPNKLVSNSEGEEKVMSKITSSSSIPKGNGIYPEQVVEPEVTLIAKRRQFSAGYKARILAEADECSEAGEIGALLRREGLYSSNLSTWRRERAQSRDLKSQKRGRKGPDSQAKEMVRLQAENARLRAELARAETIIDVQKKVSQLFGVATTGILEPERK